ncbi:MAG: biotin--[acetyl-CoA-carboxylase] ligase [Planctomycetota bacterium]|nr:MAG: biotin--[acetyl-CoA-carboxylase] ligase [Planctomycetota bacterium]
MSQKPEVFTQQFLFDEVETTMTVALNKVDEGITKGLVVMANSQTQGRGRNGKSFQTPRDMGIWCTMGVEVEKNCSPHYYNKVFSVALSTLLEDSFGLEAKIKWPNDIYVGHKKICGILTELHKNGKTLLLGFGLNLNQTKGIFGNELKDIATSVYLETNKIINNRESLLEDILLAFEAALDISEESISEHYKNKSMMWGRQAMFNQEVKFIIGVDEDGALLIGDRIHPEKHLTGDLIPLENVK